ncbi:MAG: universal stress protein, partial [Bacteroidota bacterium]|nr:universal stress protein [Bacteroidota bacterium]
LMGDFVNKLWVKVLAWITAAIVLALNINLLIEKESEAIASATPSHQLTGLIALPFLVAIGFLLLYILFKPWFRSTRAEKDIISAGSLGVLTPSMKYSRVGVAIEGNDKDKGVIEQALSLCASHGTIVLIHIVTSASGFFLRERARDAASRQGEKYLASLKQDLLSNHEIDIHTAIGFGSAPKELIRIGKLEQIDLLVMASHGHRGFKDLIFGTTVSPVRHALNIPVFIVQ